MRQEEDGYVIRNREHINPVACSGEEACPWPLRVAYRVRRQVAQEFSFGERQFIRSIGLLRGTGRAMTDVSRNTS